MLLHELFHAGIGIATINTLCPLCHTCRQMRDIRRGGQCPTIGVMTVVQLIEIALANPPRSFCGHNILTIGEIHESILVGNVSQNTVTCTGAGSCDSTCGLTSCRIAWDVTTLISRLNIHTN